MPETNQLLWICSMYCVTIWFGKYFICIVLCQKAFRLQSFYVLVCNDLLQTALGVLHAKPFLEQSLFHVNWMIKFKNCRAFKRNLIQCRITDCYHCLFLTITSLEKKSLFKREVILKNWNLHITSLNAYQR